MNSYRITPIIANLHLITLIKDIFKNSSLKIRVSNGIGDLLILIVGEHNQSVSSSECVEIVLSVSLHLGLVEPLLALANRVDGLNEFVNLCVGVKPCWPERLSVIWIVAAVELLLGTVVHNGNTFAGEDIGQGVLEHWDAWIVVQPSLVIMVIYE